MPSLLQTPSFEDFSLTIGTTRWLYQSRWNQEDFAWFHKNRHGSGLQIHLPPPVFHPKKKASSFPSSCWLLRDGDGLLPVAWVELQILLGARYRNGLLFVDPNALNPETFQGLAALLSYIFLVGRLDNIRLISTETQKQFWSLAKPTFSSESTIYSIPLGSWRPQVQPLVALQAFDMGRASWLEGETHLGILSYIKHVESRLKRYELAERKIGGMRKKRGLIARLFKPRIDDALL